MKPVLLLFDIDLTMIKTGGAGLRIMEEAFRKFTGHEGEITPISPDGKTDPLIVPELFAVNNQAYDKKIYQPFMKHYLDRLDEDQKNQTDWLIYDGVQTLLDKLSAMENMFLALVTGNEERGARIKLKPFDLNRYFPVGGFASDSAVRAELVPIAINRAEQHYQQTFEPDNVFIIGDSVGDVNCANASGVNCLAVTTGHTSREELLNSGECTVVSDLTDTDAIIRIFSQKN